MSRSNVLFMMSGSIAAYKACDVISQLNQAGVSVQVAASPSAFQFIGRATLEGLSGRPVFSDVFEEGRAMDHLSLVRTADLICLCPATADAINRFAAGIAHDALGTLFLAHDFKKPFWLVPAMNVSMWNHPATQGSIEKLKSWGVQVLGPQSGALACGEFGEGRMCESNEIFRVLHQELKKVQTNVR